jgi:hypothetical protein
MTIRNRIKEVKSSVLDGQLPSHLFRRKTDEHAYNGLMINGIRLLGPIDRRSITETTIGLKFGPGKRMVFIRSAQQPLWSTIRRSWSGVASPDRVWVELSILQIPWRLQYVKRHSKSVYGRVFKNIDPNGNFIFQQDNDPKHKTRSISQWLSDHDIQGDTLMT